MSLTDEKAGSDLKLEDTTHLEILNHNNGLQPIDESPISAYADLSLLQTMRTFWHLYCMGIIASIGAVFLGYGLSIPGNIVANAGFIEQFGTVVDPVTGAKSLDAVYVSVWGGTGFAVQVVFQLLSPLTAERYGIKTNLYILTACLLIAIVLEIVAKDWKVYLAAKIFSGIANAYLGPGLANYVAEIAMPKMRGAMLMPFTFMFAAGSLFASIALKAVASDPSKFRNAFYSQFVPFGLWVIAIIILPETPVFYCRKGLHDKAKKSLKRLIGNVQGYNFDHEYAVLQHEVKLSEELVKQYSTTGWKAIFKWNNFKRVMISAMPIMLQAISGAALTFGYSSYFFFLAGFTDPFLATLMTNVILIVGIAMSVFLVDRVGRRKLVIAGAFGCMACTIAIGGMGSIPLTNKAGPTAIVALTCLWMAFYSVSIPPVGWVYLTEVSTISLRSKSIGFGATLQSFVNLIFQYTVPVMLNPLQANLGARIGYVFGGLTFVWIVLMYFFMPETKGRTHSEIDELFEKKVSFRKFAETTTSAQAAVESRGAAMVMS